MSSGYLDVTIHIDRSLGIQISKSLPYGCTIAELKQQIAQDDPTGQTRPEDFRLRASGGGVVADGQAITQELGELELTPAEEEAAEPEQAEEAAAEPDASQHLAAGQGPAKQEEKPPEDSPKQSEEETPERRLFALLDRGGRGCVSQRDVLVALRKHPPVRKLFGLPVADEKGGGGLEARLLAMQDAFEAGNGLGEIAPLFDELRGGGTDQTFTFDQFLAKSQKGRLRRLGQEAAGLLHREHSTTAAFVATGEWAVVPEGAACPGGLEYKMDMGTGKTLARLPGSGQAAKAASAGPPTPAAPRMEEGGPKEYRSVTASLFVKRSEDPAAGQIKQIKAPKTTLVYSTGRVWVGPSGGRWAEFDASRGADSGWVLVSGPGFGLTGPALVDALELSEDEPPPGGEYYYDFLGVRRGRCKCGRCLWYRSPMVAVGG